VSTFNPPHDLPDRIANVAQQVDLVIVVDDGSPKDPSDVLQRIEAKGGKAIRLPFNAGIAAALNAGINHAIHHASPDWFVTLDQDSEMSQGYVEAALATADRARSAGIEVGFIAAESINGHIGLVRDPGADFPEAFDPLQSGCVIPAETFRRVGLLDEDLFIDAVDSDFTMRVRQQGLRALMGKGCDLTHTVGEARPMTILGWHVTLRGKKNYVHYHAPFRVYYIARNGVILVKRYLLSDPVWVAKRLYTEIIQHIVRLVYGPHRRQHLRAFLNGVRDGLRGHLGRIDDSLAAKLTVSPSPHDDESVGLK
jgi:rhamnosyltransferase